MEDDLQAGDDGCYCVAFRNTYGLRRDRLFKFLAQYGQICRLTVSDVAGKRCFVRFTNPEDAVRALSGLRSSGQFTDPSSVEYVNKPWDPHRSAGSDRLFFNNGDNRQPFFNNSDNRGPVGFTGDRCGDFVSPMTRVVRRGESVVSCRGGVSSDSRVSLFVGNLPPATEEADLDDLFKLHSVRTLSIRLVIKPFKRFAFVDVENVETANCARGKLDGYKLGGSVLRVVESKNDGHPGLLSSSVNGTGTGVQRRALLANDRRQRAVEPPDIPHQSASSLHPRQRPVNMPPLILPGPEPVAHSGPMRPLVGERRTFNQRVRMNGESQFEVHAPLEKRPRVRTTPITARLGIRRAPHSLPPFGPDEIRPPSDWRQRSPPPLDSGISDRIKNQLHAPCEVVVANFPNGFSEIDILELFKPYNPMSVRIMVGRAGFSRDDFTYAYVTLSNRMGADQAVLELENRLVDEQRLVVEMKKC